jgi:hypothetical protein
VSNDNNTEIFVLNRELPKGTIKVVKTLNTKDGDPHVGVPFELKRYRDEEVQICIRYRGRWLAEDRCNR